MKTRNENQGNYTMISANGTAKIIRTGLQLEQDKKRQAILDEMVRLRPDTEFKQNTYTTDLVYYSASVVKGRVVISKDTRSIHINADPVKLVNYGFRTELEARNAINEVMPKALEHFETCLTEFKALKANLNFSVGYNIDGDLYGTYNEYDYIEFKMNDFNFQFEINE